MGDDGVGDRLLDSLEHVPVPRSRIDDVFGRVVARQKHYRWLRMLGAAAAAVLVVVGIVLPLAGLLPLEGPPGTKERTAPGGGTNEQTLSVGGLHVSLPKGWDGQAFYIRGYSRPVIRLATFPLPGTDDIRASEARAMMDEGDVLVGLTEYSAVCPCPGFDRASGPISITGEDFQTPYEVWHDLPPQGNAVPREHDLARRTFVANHRYFDLWVEFGRAPAAEPEISAVNTVLGSLTIGDFEPPLAPDGVCNEWSLQKDPDCPQTIWVKSVLSEAGFRVLDSPQEQTLVGEGGAAKFFIWTRDASRSLAESGLRYHSTVEGVEIYGGEHLVWAAQGLNVWIAPGPRGGDKTPDEAGLAALVRASMQVEYPPET